MKRWTKWTKWTQWTKWTSTSSTPSMASIVAVALLVVFIAQSAFACPVCFGEDDSKAREGMNNAILVLLGVVGAVQLGFVAMFWSFWRRTRRGAPSARP